MTNEIKAQIFASAQRRKCLLKVILFDEMEKMPRPYQSQAIKNHSKKAIASLEQIQLMTGILLKTKQEDVVDDYTYALWRIFNKLIGATEEQLIEIAEGLESMGQEEVAA